MISSQVKFRNDVRGTVMTNWFDNGDNQIAFSRGNRGFIAFNGQFGAAMNIRLQTGLSGGTYCDVISGARLGTTCTGASVVVSSVDGMATINIPANHATGVIAIHSESKL